MRRFDDDHRFVRFLASGKLVVINLVLFSLGGTVLVIGGAVSHLMWASWPPMKVVICWVLLMVGGVFVSIGANWLVYTRGWDQPLIGCCRQCGYDLTGNVSGVCPQCGVDVGSL